jgi:UDP-galactopyranose mutase
MITPQEIIDYINNSAEVQNYLKRPLPAINNPSPPYEIYGPIVLHFVKKGKGKIDPELIRDFVHSYIRLIS